MRVALLVTGKTELLAMPTALKRLFPAHDFEAVTDIPDRPFHGFTSCPLPPPPEPVPSAVDELVAAATSRADPAVPGSYDHVVILDDLELANRAQVGVVVDVVRHSVRRHLSGFGADPARESALRGALRTRVSFHLVRPMIESWFFGAPTALTVAGISAAYHVRGGDHEQFESTDRGYITAIDTDCPCWCRNRKPKNDRPKWLGQGAGRIYHPKGYLQWLMIDGSHHQCTSYVESQHGVAALSNIDWERLLAAPERATFARALVADLADSLGHAPTVSHWKGDEPAELSRSTARHQPTLRNI